MKVLLLSDLNINDIVETPSGRRALVKGIDREAVVLRFTDDGEDFTMLPHLLRLIAPAKPRPFPAKFFGQPAGAGV